MPHTTTYEFPVCRSPRSFERLAVVPVVALRLYLASVWLRFALMKIQGGWLTSNALHSLLTTVGAGHLPSTFSGYHFIARMLVATHADALLSVLIPCTELAVGFAMVFGIAPRIAAVVAIALNFNLLLAGVGSLSLDGRMIVLQAILIALVTLFGDRARLRFLRWR